MRYLLSSASQAKYLLRITRRKKNKKEKKKDALLLLSLQTTGVKQVLQYFQVFPKECKLSSPFQFQH